MAQEFRKVKIDGKIYFDDYRLKVFRNVDDHHDCLNYEEVDRSASAQSPNQGQIDMLRKMLRGQGPTCCGFAMAACAEFGLLVCSKCEKTVRF